MSLAAITRMVDVTCERYRASLKRTLLEDAKWRLHFKRGTDNDRPVAHMVAHDQGEAWSISRLHLWLLSFGDEVDEVAQLSSFSPRWVRALLFIHRPDSTVADVGAAPRQPRPQAFLSAICSREGVREGQPHLLNRKGLIRLSDFENGPVTGYNRSWS